jgi:hypothetical protein
VSKREIRELLSSLMPYVNGQKQATALFTVALLLLMFGKTHAFEFDAPHLHIESAPVQTTTMSMIAASGTAGPAGMTITQIS